MSPPRARALGDGADLRSHLIEVTAALIEDAGPGELTTRRIARAAGVADGVLYNHFADKDALVVAALLTRAAAAVAALDDDCPRPGDGDVHDNVALLAGALLTVQGTLAPMLGWLVGDRALLQRFLDGFHERVGGPDRILGAVHGYLEGEQRLGRVDSGAPVHVIGVLLFSIAQTQALAGRFSNADADAEAQRRALAPVVSFLAAGLEPRR